ncbi:MAG: hypothetical protein AAF196_01260 [Planctomycetota bacterium]
MNLVGPIVSLLFVASVAAQDPVAQLGSASAVDPNAPTRISTIGTPRIGDASFGFRLEGAVPNSNAFLLLSSNHDSFVIFNLEILIELGPNAISVGPIPVDADGVAEFPLPIDPNGSLLDTRLVAQWLSQDPASASGLVATRAARVTVSQPDLRAFVATATQVQLRDESSTLDTVSIGAAVGAPSNTDVSIAVRADGRVAVAAVTRSEAVPQLRWFDVGTSSLTPIGMTDLDGVAAEVAFHPATSRLYALSGLSSPGPSPSTVRVFDADPDSPLFMTEIDSITVDSGVGGGRRIAFSPSGDRLIINSAFAFNLIDTEPGSPTEGEVVLVRTVGLLDLREVAPSGDSFFRLTSFGVEEIDVLTGSVVATTEVSGVIPIGQLELSPSGEVAVARLFGSIVSVFDPQNFGAPPTDFLVPDALGQLSMAFSLDGRRVFGTLGGPRGSDVGMLDRDTLIQTSVTTGLTDLVLQILVR